MEVRPGRMEPQWCQQGAGHSPTARTWCFYNDLIHGILSFYGIGPWMLVRAMGVPLVTHVHHPSWRIPFGKIGG